MGVVTLLGAGSWGTALACAFSYLPPERSPRAIRLWGRDHNEIARIASNRENKRYLPDLPLPAQISPTSDLNAALQGATEVFFAIPAQQISSLLRELSLPSSVSTLVCCAKGIEVKSGCFMSELFVDKFPKMPYAILSGPSFSEDVVRRLPVAVTLACKDFARASDLCAKFSHDRFRLYASKDVRGVEIGGACKNVLALACGIVEGSSLGLSARAALIARALAELRRFFVASAADEETLHGLSGLGDALLTCTSKKSRNYAFGYALGAGENVNSLLARSGTVEGVWTARALQRRLASMDIDLQRDLPILFCIASILEQKMTIDSALEHLFSRPLVPEFR